MNNNKVNEVRMNALEQKLYQIDKYQLVKDYIKLKEGWQNIAVKNEIYATLIYIMNPRHPIFDNENDVLNRDQVKQIKKNFETGKFDIIFRNIGVIK